MFATPTTEIYGHEGIDYTNAVHCMRWNTSHDLRLVEITKHRTYKISSLHNVLLDLDWLTCEMRYLHQQVLPRNKTRAHRQIMSSSHYTIRSLQESKVVFVTCSKQDRLRMGEQFIRIDRLTCYLTQGTAIDVIQQTRHWDITGIRRQKEPVPTTMVHRNRTTKCPRFHSCYIFLQYGSGLHMAQVTGL